MRICIRTFLIFAFASVLTGCITALMQGYADREPPKNAIGHIVAYVAAPTSLATSIHSSIISEAKSRGVIAEDALTILPPTRNYTNAEIQKTLQSSGADGVLIVKVGDSGIMSQYAGTYFQSQTFGTTSINGTMNTFNGTMNTFGNTSNISLGGTSIQTTSGMSAPIYRYKRQTAFTARLIEASSGRTLWVGNGQVSAGGLLFAGDGANASNSISAIFDDLSKKGLIGGSTS
jgi:hypothetical protein